MSDPLPPGVIGEGWNRLHPLSPLVRLGRVGLAIVVVVVSSVGAPSNPRDHTQQANVLIYAALIAGAVLGGVVSWLVTRWRIHGGDLQLERGLIRRQSFRIPLERIQAVDVVAPMTARLLGLAEVRVVSAGRGVERGRLAYVSAAEAPVLRARLLALAHGLAPETPEPVAQQLMAVDNFQLGMGLLLRAAFLAPLALVVVGELLLATAAGNSARAIVGIGFSSTFIGLVPTIRRFNDDFGFSVSQSPDGLRLDRGLLQRRHETIPYGRIQAVRWVEPLIWRVFGWSRLEVDVARQGVARSADPDAQQVARTLMPIARREQTAWLLWHVLPAAGLTPPVGSKPPQRARLKAPLSYHFLAAWRDAMYVYARTGRLQSSTVVAPLTKIQSVRLVTGPVQRLLKLATVHVDTAGHRWQASAHSRDAAEAATMLDETAELARRARRVTPTG